MGVDSCISSHHRHYLHRARPWAHISLVLLDCIMYTSGKRTHIFDSSLTHSPSTAHSLDRTHSLRTCIIPSNGSILFRSFALIACAIYIKTKMKIHCVYTPHSIFMCKYLRALFFFFHPAPSLLHFSIYVVALVFITFSFSLFPNDLVVAGATAVAGVMFLLMPLLLLLLLLLFCFCSPFFIYFIVFWL